MRSSVRFKLPARHLSSRYRCAMANELILIVEENPKNLKPVRDTPQVKGYQTFEAETAKRVCALPMSGSQRSS